MKCFFNIRNKLFLFLCLIFIPISYVDAISFSNNYGRVCYDNNFVFSSNCDPNKTTHRTKIKKTNNGVYAYCANRKRDFGGNTSYKLDNSFSKAKNCPYYLKDSNNKWVKYPNGDCSSIVGYVIAEGFKVGQKKSNQYGYFLAQASLWTYLGKYAPEPYKTANQSASNGWSNATIKSILTVAWKNYSGVSSIIENSEKDDVNFSIMVTGGEHSFYYRPNGAGCGGGSYITKNIRITNNESRPINISIPVTSDAVSICIAGTQKCYSKGGANGESLTYSLSSGQFLDVYLSTNYKLQDNVDFMVIASYGENQTLSTTIYDSKRYDKSGYQGMIVPSSKVGNVTSAVIHESQKEIVFSQVAIEHISCPSSQQTSGNIFVSNTSNSPVRKVCANNSQGNNVNDYTVYFSGCNCMSIDLGGNRTVNVILHENVGFRFGNLSPNKVYAGGGFKLVNSNEGITTVYESKITWQYADYYGSVSNNIPYYYNANNSNLYRATDVENEIVAKIREVIKNQVPINFSTRDSNDPVNTSIQRVPIYLNMSSIQYDGNQKTFHLQSGDIQMNAAYFSTDGRVSYIKNDTRFPIFGGYKYYVPLKYKENTFPFDIGLTNLSSFSNGNFWYQADCDIDIDKDNDLYDSLNGVRYRSIDVADPFPKMVALNWQTWWKDSLNRSRMKNTFQNYPGQPLYQITLNSNKFTQIGNISSSYADWSNVKKNGSSDFVDRYFDRKAEKSSYCEIGQFSVNCDR